jgi:hypothetical protein
VHIFDPVAQTWSAPANPTTRPAARVDGKLEWAGELGAFLYFGGNGNVSDDLPRYNDLWALRLTVDGGVDWTPFFPTGTPPSPRGAVCGAWIPDRRQLVFFGGEVASAVMSSELWAWDLDSNAWLPLPNANAPPARAFCGTTYLPRHGRLLLHGGQSGTNPVGGSWTYAFDAGAWTLHADGGANPQTVSDSAAGYNASLAAAVFFGGRATPAPTTTYSNSTWLAQLNFPPQADAGPSFGVDEGALVSISNATATDPEGDSLTFNWGWGTSLVAPLNDPFTLAPSFVAPTVTQDSVMELKLFATDVWETSTSTVVITVRDAINEPPVADAGPDFFIESGATGQLLGSAVDPNNDAISSWTWIQLAGPIVPMTLGQNISFPAPVVTVNTILQFALKATDVRGGISNQDEVFVTVTPIDGGTLDGGEPDAGAPDAGTADAGAPDAGAPDAGASDAGTPDAGEPDAGEPDPGLFADAGLPDAGAEGEDAGLAPRTYGVGCGCGAGGSAAAPWLWLLLLGARRLISSRRR